MKTKDNDKGNMTTMKDQKAQENVVSETPTESIRNNLAETTNRPCEQECADWQNY